jgi:5-methylcytosine-specific restriction endonuclease McrA
VKKIDKVKLSCRNCGVEFFVYPSEIRKKRKYCSRKCFFEDIHRIMKEDGRGSGAKGKRWTHTEDYKKRLSEARMGEKNPSWKGGISADKRKYKRGWKHELWKRKVFEEFGESGYYFCMGCLKEFKDKENLVAHHMLSYSGFPKERYNVDNGMILCKECHRKAHKDDVTMRKAMKIIGLEYVV